MLRQIGGPLCLLSSTFAPDFQNGGPVIFIY
jgi:hypothetical protein